FGRSLDLRWRRTSYSGITAAAHDEQVGSEPEDPGPGDEPVGGTVGSGTLDANPLSGEARRLSLWSDLPAGAAFGTFVHGVLERTDFRAADLDAALADAIAAERLGLPVDGAFDGTADELLADGIRAALTTPLGPLADGVSLSSIGRPDRLDELGFELPLCGGDEPAGEVLIEDIAAVFAESSGSPGLSGYAERLRGDPLLASHLRGYLSGSLDLVMRRPGPEGDRYFVADYKTNRLGVSGQPVTLGHYRPEALAVEMQRAHYPLQAALYLVALHRYLRWRVPDYRPESHRGGVLYLFLRGMAGPDVPMFGADPCGVFGWRPPAAMVTRLSDLLAAG